MRVVQALGWYFPDGTGGTEVYVAALCRRLHAAGHEVMVTAPDPGADRERTYEHEGIPVYRYPIAVPPSREEAQGSVSARGAERFHAWLTEQRADVVHMHTFVTGLGLPELRVASRLGARVIATTHSSSLGFLCARGTLMRWGRELCDGIVRPSTCSACVLQSRGVPRVFAQLAAAGLDATVNGFRVPGRVGTALSMPSFVRANVERQREMMQLVHRFVVLTDAAYRVVEANGFSLDRVRVNRLGVDAAASGNPPSLGQTRPLTIAYVGRYEPLKGVEVLARAAALLPPSLDVRIEFRGPVRSDDERRTMSRVRALAGGDARVRFADAVPHDDVARVLRTYDVVCCPALCLEGGPTVALEAHAQGVPVIGSRIGGLAEMVTDGVNGRLVPPGDAKALASAIASIASDPDGTLKRWRAALPRPRTMDEVTQDYLAMYAGA